MLGLAIWLFLESPREFGVTVFGYPLLALGFALLVLGSSLLTAGCLTTSSSTMPSGLERPSTKLDTTFRRLIAFRRRVPLPVSICSRSERRFQRLGDPDHAYERFTSVTVDGGYATHGGVKAITNALDAR